MLSKIALNPGCQRRGVYQPLISVLWVVIALLSTATPAAQPEEKESVPKALIKQIDRVERALKRTIEHDIDLLNQWLKQINTFKASAGVCVPVAEKALEKVNKDLESLGIPATGEPAEVARQRRTLGEERTAQENRLATCRVILQRSDELIKKITVLEGQVQARRLFARGPNAVELLRDERLRLTTLVTAMRTFVRVNSGIEYVSASRLIVLVVAFTVALVVGGLLRRRLLHWTRRHTWHANLSSQLGRSLVTAFAHYAPYLLFTIAACLFFAIVTWTAQPKPFLAVLAYGLLPYFLSFALIHVFLWPFPPAESFLPVPPDVGKALARRLKLFVLLVLVGYLLFVSLLAQSLPDPVVFLGRTIFALVFFVNLAWALWLLGQISALAGTLLLRATLLLVLLGVLIAELAGYRNLTLAALSAVFGTLFAFGILLLTLRLLRDLYEGLDRGRDPWHRQVRSALALKPGDRVPGLLWAWLILSLFLWAVFALLLLEIWGLPDAFVRQIYSWGVDGFTVGSLHVTPARILLAVIVFTLLLAFSGWVRSRLKRKWLPRMRLDRGAREATVTVGGYVGAALAVIIALSVSGFEFTSLAIIAGALSVGIGFGLQNIVNNFVSGLILLFERPVKTGDWIVVGNTEGYVKRIRIRSTEIQTFDRADVIVPNSDLISQQVTNWMHRDPRGRIRVPVSVAYGSDTEKVREILQQLATEHPEIICDGSSPEPRVLFWAFGESSLDFELRCHIQNIDMRRIVTSDLNFAIDKAFRAQGIEIPFPQRDVHVRNWPAEKKELPVKTPTTRRKR